MKTVAIIAARMGSTRLPGKVLMALDAWPVLRWVVESAWSAIGIDDVCVATTTKTADDKIVRYIEHFAEVYRGSETDVLRRYAECAAKVEADVIVRLTGDCPFTDSNIIGMAVMLHRRRKVAYTQNVSPATWPDGLDVEVFNRDALEQANRLATRASDRDCLTQYLERNRIAFSNAYLPCPIPGLDRERFVLDTKKDYEFCKAIARRSQCRPANYLEILKILEAEPRLRDINKTHKRNERFLASIAVEHV